MRKILSIINTLVLTLSLFSQVETNRDSIQTIKSSLDDLELVNIYDSLILQEFSNRYLKINSIKNNTEFDHVALSDSVLNNRISYLNRQTPIQFPYNSTVKTFIELYVNKRRNFISCLLGKKDLYFPIFEEKLRAHNIPLELKYLPIIESALNGSAKSRAGAAGLWQFMVTTGKIYGLQVTSFIDERADVEKATEAACKYLKFLYSIYKDWGLAISAYNAGPGNVNRAIRRSGGKKSFWEVKHYLPRETQSYFPAFLAVLYAFNYFEEHNIYKVDYTPNIFQVDTILVKRNMSFEQLSSILSVPIKELEILNPQYYKNVIPSDKNGLALKLPLDKLSYFVSNEDSIYNSLSSGSTNSFKKEEKLNKLNSNKIVYYVQSGDYLGKIAKVYNVSVNDLQNWNNLSSIDLFIGQKIEIYQTDIKSMHSKPSKRAQTYYTVKQGDTLWEIANKFVNISVDDIRRNNLNLNPSNLKIGQQIIIPTQ